MKIGKRLLVVALLFIALVLVNYLASSIPLRADFTAGKIYTLSPGTKSLLSKLEEPLVLDFYFTRSASNVPISFKNYGERIEEMLHQYVRASGGKVSLNVIDPRPDTPEEEKAVAAGVASQALPTGEKFYFGIVATQADQRKNISAVSPQREQFLEYDLSQLIYQVQQIDKKRLGLLTSLPLRAPPPNPMTRQSQGQSQFSVKEWESTFEIVMVNPSESVLPDNLDVLAVLHPQNVSPRLQFAIDQYILSGKPALIAVDPSSLIFKSQQSQMDLIGGASPNVSSDLPFLLGAYGVSYDPRKFIGDLESPLGMTDPNTGVNLRNPAAIAVSSPNINTVALPTAQLSSLWFIEAGSLSPIAAAGTTFTPLVQTSAQTGEAESVVLQVGEVTDIGRQLTKMGQRTIAALVTGKFKTAFPSGAPPAEPPPEGAPPMPEAPPPPANPLKESTGTSAIIVVADTDWLFDSYSVATQNFFGQVLARPMNNNLAFASNSVEFLGGSQDLISLRGKGPAERSFQVVDKMVAEANKRYTGRLAEVKKQLAELQDKLGQMEDQNSKANLLVPSAQEQKMIDDYKKQHADLLREQREIRRALREDVDALETRLLATNLLATPLLVCLFGLWFYRQRRR